MSWQILLARLRIPLAVFTLLVLLIGDWGGTPPVVRLLVFLAVYWVVVRPGTVRRAPIPVVSPVAGRLRAVNSPADRVPSHGVQVYGQTYAIDLVHEPTDGARPRFAVWPIMRRPTDFPSFGQPVYAPVDGVVVRTHDRERDHLSRNSWLGMIYLLLESVARELTGLSRILGNHVIIDTGDGAYAVVAHLMRRSVRVRPGQRVVAGEHIADCGNSGNSTEPHVHFQLMDHRRALVAAGLPFEFEHAGPDGIVRRGVPSAREPFTVAPQPVARH